MMDRVGIYALSAKEEAAQKNDLIFLTELSRYIQHLIVVSSEASVPDDIRSIADDFVMNEDGSDLWQTGYAKAVERGLRYHEIVFCRDALLGPLYSFADIFSCGDRQSAAVWSVTPDSADCFAVVKSGREADFLSGTVTEIAPVCYDENLYALTDTPMLTYPDRLVADTHCPFVKKEIFYADYSDKLGQSLGASVGRLYAYIRQHDLYDEGALWDDLCHSGHQSDLVKNFNFHYVFAEGDEQPQPESDLRLALFIHIYYEDLTEKLLTYAKHMPACADVYITTDTEVKAQHIRTAFASSPCAHCRVSVIENRGRDVSALLIGAKDVVGQYDLACFIHDKKSLQNKPGSVGEGFCNKCYDNILGSSSLCLQIIRLFSENARLGMLSPLPPHHGNYFHVLGNEWSINYDNALRLKEKLALQVPISPLKEPVAPFGTVFWFRPAALTKLFAYPWQYEDFPPEPSGNDATILNAIERLYPFVAQDAGFYPATVMTAAFSANETLALASYVRDYNRLATRYGLMSDFAGTKQRVQAAFEKSQALEAKQQELTKVIGYWTACAAELERVNNSWSAELEKANRHIAQLEQVNADMNTLYTQKAEESEHTQTVLDGVTESMLGKAALKLYLRRNHQ